MTDQPCSTSRRRCLTVLAGAAAGTLLGSARAHAGDVHEWRGTALGADARIVLGGRPRPEATMAMARLRAEIERLERVFSLYRQDSALVRLNGAGILDPAPLELLDLARRSLWFTRASGGAFDVTVQPLWELHARHYGRDTTHGAGPSDEAVAAARALTGPEKVQVTETGIRLAAGARLTFNGIAQGYITDRVSALLTDMGWRNVLVNLGELRALGTRAGGAPWRVAVPDGRQVLVDKGALATSAADGLRFRPGGPHHLFDPRTGRSSAATEPVTVAAPLAADADMLSTALAVLNPAAWTPVLGRVSGAKVV